MTDPGVDVEWLYDYLVGCCVDDTAYREVEKLLLALAAERDEAVEASARWRRVAERCEGEHQAAEQRAEKAEGLLREWMNYTNEPDDGSVDFVDVVFELNWRKKVRAATDDDEQRVDAPADPEKTPK